MMGREKRAWGQRTAGLAWLLGTMVLAIAPDAFSQAQRGKKPPAAAEEPPPPPVNDPADGTPLDDSLRELFTADGKLAGYADAKSAGGRKAVAQLPPPSAAQIKSLARMQTEAEAYEKAAKDYRDTITRIVTQHYETRRHRMLAGMDREITIEQEALVKARNEAIARLEAFVERYSGPNAQPEVTPDAMYRLAALYDERARASSATDISGGLKPAIALYKRIIREFPDYRELAGVYYYLGHALYDSNRLEEAQQVWRSLVCHNQYPYPVPTDPADPDRDIIKPLPQDHDQAFWSEWHRRYPTPETLKTGGQTKGRKAKGKSGAVETLESDETVFLDPFPNTCTPVPQKTEPGRDPRYLAEVWWKIGDWYFDEVDPHAGPFSFNRAVSAYRHSMAASSVEKGVLYGVSMYKLAWTYFKQQRYEAATRQFVDLLRYTDDVQKRTGDPGADFRSEAYTYIAGSVTYLDFAGPPESEPFVPRPDAIDLYGNEPAKMEEKMRVAITRVQDATLIPQDQPWSVNIYKALTDEFKDLNQAHNRIDVSELMLQRWPMSRDAPEIQAGIADTYEEMARLSREGTVERKENAAKALEARSKLAVYVGNSPWVQANKDDPEALQLAERLVRGGLQRAAAEHTNIARQYAENARNMGDAKERNAEYARALQEYRLAEKAWASYIAQDENASDVYESRFWLADARHGIVETKVAMGVTPTGQDVLKARQAAIEVRDSNEDDRFQFPAAYYAVNLAFLVRDDRLRVARESNGAQGLKERTELEFAGEGKEKKVVKAEFPAAVKFLNLSQQEYIDRVPPDKDQGNKAAMFRFQIAESYFFYGQFDEAQKRYEPIYKEDCGKTEYGYKAWERLLTMSNLQGDVEQSRRLAEEQQAKSCAVSEEQKTAATLLINPTLQEAAYRDARTAFEEAKKMKDGPEREAMWRKAAALYKTALEKAPDRDEAPEAAMNGAYCYKQVGEYDKAIEMYELFISRYGDEKTLARLEKGDAKARPPVAADPEKYKDRVKYLKMAYDALSSAYVLFFNYRKAAEEYDTISQIERFEQKDRRDAARNALTLYANMGDQAKIDALRKRLVALGASPEEKAEADFIVVKADMNAWDERGRDEGANRAARQRAIGSMTRYHDANKNSNDAAKFVVLAAYNVAKLKRAGNETGYQEWYKKTIAAFEKYKATAPMKDGKSTALGSEQAAKAAEAEFVLLDAEIREKFDYDTGHHRYAGTTVDVINDYRKDAAVAKQYHDKLQHVIDAYLSPDWVVAARSRQGSLYDSLRTGLYNARPPSLKLYSDKEEKLLKKLEESDNPAYQEKADQFRQNRIETWRQTRDREITDADKVMVKRFVESYVLGRKYNVSNPAVDHAVERLAFFTEILGDDKMREYSQGIEGFTYTERMFLRSRPGITRQPDVQPMPNPLPVVPQ